MNDLTTRAIQNLRPGAHWGITNDDYVTLEWLDDPATKPTLAEVNTEIARLQTPVGIEEMRQNDEVRRIDLAVVKALRNHENRLRVVENALSIDGNTNRNPVTLAQIIALLKSLM
jgi:hypothetical protein